MARKRRSRRPRKTKKGIVGFLGWIALAAIGLSVAMFLTSTGKRWLYSSLLVPKHEEAGFWQVYFTSQCEPELALSDLIRDADSSVDLAFYQLNNPVVILAILDVKDRVKVRAVVESDNADSWGVQRLREAGVPIREDNRGPLMHNKFAVIDNEILWTGSYNLTPTGAKSNYDNVIVVRSRALSHNYELEFSEMWNGQFGGSSPRNTRCCFVLDSVEVENYFAPEDGVASHVISQLSQAEKQIIFMAYSFTDSKIARIMIQKHQQGLDVQGIFNWRQENDKYSVWPKLANAGVPVFFSPKDRTLHHKVMVIDSQIVITGSFNFTKSANKRNDENLIIIHSRSLALAYLREYQRLKSRSSIGVSTAGSIGSGVKAILPGNMKTRPGWF